MLIDGEIRMAERGAHHSVASPFAGEAQCGGELQQEKKIRSSPLPDRAL